MPAETRLIIEAATVQNGDSTQAVVHTLPGTPTLDCLRALLALASTSLTEARRILETRYTRESTHPVTRELDTIEKVLDHLVTNLTE